MGGRIAIDALWGLKWHDIRLQSGSRHMRKLLGIDAADSETLKPDARQVVVHTCERIRAVPNPTLMRAVDNELGSSHCQWLY